MKKKKVFKMCLIFSAILFTCVSTVSASEPGIRNYGYSGIDWAGKSCTSVTALERTSTNYLYARAKIGRKDSRKTDYIGGYAIQHVVKEYNVSDFTETCYTYGGGY